MKHTIKIETTPRFIVVLCGNCDKKICFSCGQQITSLSKLLKQLEIAWFFNDHQTKVWCYLKC